MRPQRRRQTCGSMSCTGLPARSLYNATEVGKKDENSCEPCEDPEPSASLHGLWGRDVRIGRQRLVLGFVPGGRVAGDR